MFVKVNRNKNQKRNIMKTFKDVQIGQTFYTSNGQPSKKLTNTRAVSLAPHYCGFDWQDVKFNVEFNSKENAHVYGIGKA